MTIARHPDFRLQRLRIGREQAPLVVIDNLVADPDDLVNVAAIKAVRRCAELLPRRARQGLRSPISNSSSSSCAACSPKTLLSRQARCDSPPATIRWSRRRRKNSPTCSAFRTSIRWSAKNSPSSTTCSKPNLGGTAFYRHRKTGFEYVDQDRKPEYLRCHGRREARSRQPARRIHQRRYTALRAARPSGRAFSTAC